MQTRVGAVTAMRLARPGLPASGPAAAVGALCLWSCFAVAARAQDPAPATPEGDPAATASTASDLEAQYGPPLITADERKDWERNHGSKYRSALTAEHPGPAEKEELQLGMKTALYSLTLYESDGDAQKFWDIVRSLSDDLRRNITKAAAREIMNAELVKVAGDLLDKGPKSRLNAVIIVGSLSVEPPPVNGPPPKPYVPGYKLLLTALNEPSQFVACKIWAANGLARICREGDVGINERNNIAADLITALDGPQAKLPANWWYRMRLIDALGDSGLVYNLVQKPVVMDALMKVLTDRQESWILRCVAARAVTQLPWTATTNVPLITYEIGSLTKELAQARNQQPGDPLWRPCIFNIYMSFIPETQANMQKRWGLLQQVERPGLGGSKPIVQAGYQVVLPIVNSITGNAAPVPIPAPLLQNLDNWLQNNAPQNLKVQPESEELKQTEPRPKPITGGGGHSASWSADGTRRDLRCPRRLGPRAALATV